MSIIARLRAAVRAFKNPWNVLTSTDGKFKTDPDLAVEAAYLLSNAEYALSKPFIDTSGIGSVLADYADGDMTFQEANDEFRFYIEDSDEIEQRAEQQKAAEATS